MTEPPSHLQAAESDTAKATDGSRRAESDTGSARLSRDAIIKAALAFIDERPLAELTMRRLGASLGVEGMALYRYISSRDVLLDAAAETILDSMHDDPEVFVHPHNGWQDFVRRLAHGIRRAALAHPAAFPLVVSRPPRAPWLRPPLRSLYWVEIFLSGLIESGFNDSQGISAYRAFTSFLLGRLLLEAAIQQPAFNPSHTAPAGIDDLAHYPNLARMSDGLSHDTSQAEFDDALDDLVDRLQQLHAHD